MEEYEDFILDLVFNTKQYTESDNLLRRFNKANSNDILEGGGFFCNDSLILKPYLSKDYKLESKFQNKRIVELRLDITMACYDRVLIAITEQDFLNSGLLNNFSYLQVIGKKRFINYFYKEQESYNVTIPFIDVISIKVEDVINYFNLPSTYTFNKIANILHKLVPNNLIVEGTLLNLLDSPSNFSNRSYTSVPLIFSDNSSNNSEIKSFMDKYKSWVGQVTNGLNKLNMLKINFSEDKKQNLQPDIIFTPVSHQIKLDEPVLSKSDAPILVDNPFLVFEGLGDTMFSNNDLNYLSPLITKFILQSRLRVNPIKSIELLNKFDKYYVDSYNDSLYSLPDRHRYYYLGMSAKDYFNSPDNSIRYGGKFNLYNLQNEFDLKIDYPNIYPEEFIRQVLNKKWTMTDEYEIYKMGVDMDKKGYGEMRKSINEIRDIITTVKSYSIEKKEIDNLVEKGKIRHAIMDNLEKEGLIFNRPNGKVSLHPVLLR